MGVGRCGSEKKVTATIKYTSKSYNLLSKYEIKSTPHLVFYPACHQSIMSYTSTILSWSARLELSRSALHILCECPSDPSSHAAFPPKTVGRRPCFDLKVVHFKLSLLHSLAGEKMVNLLQDYLQTKLIYFNPARTAFASWKLVGRWPCCYTLSPIRPWSRSAETALVIDGHKAVKGGDMRVHLIEAVLQQESPLGLTSESQCAKARSRPPPLQVTHTHSSSHYPPTDLHPLQTPRLLNSQPVHLDEFISLHTLLLDNLGGQIAQYNLV